MSENRSAAVGLAVVLAGLVLAWDTASAANIRNHIEAVRRDASVVFLGEVGEIETSERLRDGGLDARAEVRVLHVARSPVDAHPPAVTLEYPTWDDDHPPYAGDGQHRLDRGSLVVVFADSWEGLELRYLLKGGPEELLNQLVARRDGLVEMSEDDLEFHEIDEADRQTQVELYRKLAASLE